MNIKHVSGLEVIDVEVVEIRRLGGMEKGWIDDSNGSIYYPYNGWSEVKEPVTRDVTGEVVLNKEATCVWFKHNGKDVHWPPNGYTFRTVQRYDLPEVLTCQATYLESNGRYGKWYYHNDMMNWLVQFLKPCFIVEKTE